MWMIECMQILPLLLGGRKVISERPSAQMQQIQVQNKGKSKENIASNNNTV